MARPDHTVFLKRSFSRMDQLATPFLTGRRLCRQLAQVVPYGTDGVVVELGAGSGVLAEPIRARLGNGARYLAIEIDEELVAHLRRHKPWLEVVQGDVADLERILDDAGIDRVDAFVSTLPWAVFPQDLRTRVLDVIARRLVPGGVLSMIITWMALPNRVRDLRALLDAHFDEVVETATEWRNPPPARTFLCRRPLARPDYLDERDTQSAS
ncbi:phosphatidylethanolamine N-methyltransferase /phosphatidyl-N-methylethanolamine N-methyltransferase [Pseudonocardia ammonioxydans]|uniref:Phosphatidylethanolamine N-methyltransferase /phosphatidyl-N-methylethanolamine N-methyltransferase n=1 Tax=Pseudonocardia ammonioxydans TaxID=260086 RepID=A0A1I5BTX2_PSUAM|nr:methyltransferase domain-containing protein [Pseudonocardia ammonioxydans]SFN78206.1 phosphatidylethanolamine N-methyltransferase /phosphatidyl-N-methylethanolamine N-methyltransferase [Pseudonocardia ammonioxydans]